MRHLFVTNDFPPKAGGIESYLTGLTSGFPPEDVTVIAPTREGHVAVDDELPYSVVRVPSKYLGGSRRVRRLVVSTAQARRVDVVHYLHALPLGRLGRAVRKQTGLPYTVFAHGSEVLVPARMPFFRRSLRRVLAEADRVFAVSEYTRTAVERVSKGEAKTAVLTPSVDTTRFSLAVSGERVRTERHLGSRFIVLFVSRLVKRKGADTLIRAIAKLSGAAALIVGSGPEEAALKRLAEELEVAGRVVFAGRVPDEQLPEYYAAGDVFCMPCTDRYGGVDTEGFGIVYLEAQASGLPCVAGACGGSVEAVVDQETGFVVPEPSSHSVARVLRKLEKDPLMRAKMGAAGRDRAERDFSPTVQSIRLERELRGVVDASEETR